MAAWRDMLDRFRKPTSPYADAEPTDNTAVNTLVASPDDDEHDTEPLPPLPPTGSYETHRFGDTTRALDAVAPLIVALQHERVQGAAALRDLGRERRENQDHCFAQMLSFPTDQGDLTLGIFVVADGMGGHHDGGYASKLALTTTVRCILTEFVAPLLAGERSTPQPIMQAALQAANTAVYEAGQAAGSDMGTTCTATLWYGGELITAHVGDSRALLIGSGVNVLTTDHTAVGRLIAIGAMTPEEAHDHPLRNQLYRSIGQQADVPVDVVTTPLHDERYLVLCSDGLWGLVANQEIAEIVMEAPTPQAAARHLIARANLLGGHDNISAVVAALPTGGNA